MIEALGLEKGGNKALPGRETETATTHPVLFLNVYSKRIFLIEEEKMPPFPFFLAGFFLAGGATIAESSSQ